MKVGLAHKRLSLKGGTERDLYRTAEGLRDLGHEVHLFCEKFEVEVPPATFAHQIPVLPAGRTARLWTAAAWAPATIRRHPCDLVLGFGRLVEQDVLRSGGGTHRGFLERLAENGGTWRRLWHRFSVYHRSLLTLEKRQYVSPGCRKILAVSEQVKRDVMQHYPVATERITVIYNGVDHERFQPKLRQQWRSPIRRELSIPGHAPVVLFIGSGFRRKGLDRLLAIWSTPSLENAYLLVVGDDARIRRYRRRARAAAGKRIVFTGRQAAVERYYGAADVLVLPSIQEAFGNVVLEALCCGVPPIVTRGVGAAEVLQGDLGQGIVDDPDDAAELVHKITVQLRDAQQPGYREKARRLGEGFSWRSHFQRLESVLMEVHAEKQGERVS
jgi:UDP-glucose:(heptosyl)LPS alpha-1,3-glucosyltransferase